MSIDQAAADLVAWLPVASALITQPDTDGTSGHGKPGSRPPWNTAIAYAITDIHAAVRTLEQDLRTTVTGSQLRRGGSDANTLRSITAIRNLAAAADAEAEITAMLERLLTPILQHPAIDLEEPPQRPPVPCPRCGRKMLRFRPRDRELACLGCGQRAELADGRVTGEPMLLWADGEITIAPEGTT